MERERVIETLNDLIENCKDGEYGFRTCAEHARSPELKRLLAHRADGCRAAAHELQAYVNRLGGTPDTGGSASGALHRRWVELRGTFSFDDDRAMLDECERGEDIAVARYRSALDEHLPEDIAATVRRQYEGARRNHDDIRALRDRIAAEA